MMNPDQTQRALGGALHARGFAAGRLLFWGLLVIWAAISWQVSGPLSDSMRSRINDLSVIPGGGLVMRDPTGVFYHVNNAGRARAIFPELAPPVYQEVCLDCTLVTGEQLSQTNDFCISGTRKTLPALQFEIPCRTWAPLGEGHNVLAFGIFVVPLLGFWILRAILQRGTP
ncbi:MAG: hypothetical protein JWQ90_3033 [Hydrocarboniphaga sp.]|uniref:hypothetical protein n=1 Tax=Hydrocarboniphaga sp. TaxID=2033016 RepID=UPI00260DFA50|nr:hypothetical protein [Hydrocarboniphaga sp.]MDB5970583.1 hypothetical protein [Hydrocarboniphaga sp.]